MLEELKERVRAVALMAQRDGLCKHKSGNFSQLDPEHGLLVVTPSGVDREALHAEDMVVMDLDCNVLENKTSLKPSSEVLMHIKIYKTRPDARAIVHTHSMYATVFAILDKPIPAISYEMMHLGCSKGRIPVAPFARPGSVELAESVVDACREADCFLMKQHGACALDEKDIEGAYLKAQYIEEMAELYHHVLTANGGREVPSFPGEELRAWDYPKEIKFRTDP